MTLSHDMCWDYVYRQSGTHKLLFLFPFLYCELHQIYYYTYQARHLKTSSGSILQIILSSFNVTFRISFIYANLNISNPFCFMSIPSTCYHCWFFNSTLNSNIILTLIMVRIYFYYSYYNCDWKKVNFKYVNNKLLKFYFQLKFFEF